MSTEAGSILAVHSLNRFAVTLPDLDEAERFYKAFGLDLERSDDRLLIRTFGSPHVWGQIERGASKRLSFLRFGIFEADLPRFAERLQDAGLLREAHSDTILCETPDGIAIELAVAPRTSTDAKPGFGLPAPFDIARGVGPRNSVGHVRPRRLSHLALFTSDVDRAIDFFAILGLRVSDRAGSDVAFLYSPHGSDHHFVALARSHGAGLHHTSWDVANLDEVGLGAAQMAEAGYPQGWGLGRHVIGSNYFHYVRDPWGSWAEYSADIDYIPAGSEWAMMDHPPEDSFYRWGPPPPDDFGTNREAAAIFAD